MGCGASSEQDGATAAQSPAQPKPQQQQQTQHPAPSTSYVAPPSPQLNAVAPADGNTTLAAAPRAAPANGASEGKGSQHPTDAADSESAAAAADKIAVEKAASEKAVADKAAAEKAAATEALRADAERQAHNDDPQGVIDRFPEVRIFGEHELIVQRADPLRLTGKLVLGE